MTYLELLKQRTVAKILRSNAADIAVSYATARDCQHCYLNYRCYIYKTPIINRYDKINRFNACTAMLEKWLESEVEDV